MTKDEQIAKLLDENYLLTQMLVKVIKESSACRCGSETVHEAAARIKKECETVIEDDVTGTREFWLDDVLAGACD